MGMMGKRGGARKSGVHKLARGLGWVSLALGTGLVAAPRAMCRLSGVDDSQIAPIMARAAGIREFGHAAFLLGSRRPARWTWTRVAGDAMDLASLTMAMMNRRGMRRMRTTIALGAVGGITAVDLLTALADTRPTRKKPLHLRAAVTVNRPTEEVYRFWRDLENLPRFMSHLDSVQDGNGDRRSHWAAKGPAGSNVEWDAEVVDDKANQLIAWRSLPGAKVPNSGQVRFMRAAGGRGTEVRVEMEYAPPVGEIGKAVAKAFGEDPDQQVKDDLRRFKQVMETGEVVRSEGSPQGLNVRQQVMQRPAQPLPRDDGR
jgi:uncharacterized membrane protein